MTTQPLLTRLCGQLCALGIREIILIAPVGRGDLLTSMAWEGLSLAGPGLAAVSNIDVIECASIAEELRAVAMVTHRLSQPGDTVLICAGDVVAHTESLARLQRSAATAALTAASGSLSLVTGPDLRPALRLSGGDGGDGGAGGRGGRGRAGAAGVAAGHSAHRAVVAAGSAFHRVHAPDAVGCGVFLVLADDGEQLAEAADELAALAAGDLAAADLARNVANGPSGNLGAGAVAHFTAGKATGTAASPPRDVVPPQPRDVVPLQSHDIGPGKPHDLVPRQPQDLVPWQPQDVVSGQPRSAAAGPAAGLAGPAEGLAGPPVGAARPAKSFAEPADDLIEGRAASNGLDDRPRGVRQGSGFTDSVALLLVGLVRSGADVEAVDSRPLVCVRVQTAQQAREAAAELNAVDEDRVRLDGAIKRRDGLFATCFVSPYARYIARWAARRRLCANAVTGMSIGLGVLAAVWFSAGSRAGIILGAAFLFAAFVLDCVDGQLARYVRGETAFGAWLGGVGGRLTEFAVYAGLAAGAVVSRSPTVWELAVAALILQSIRDMIVFCGHPVTRLDGPGEATYLPLDEPADYAVSVPAATGRPGGGTGAGVNRRRGRWLRLQARRARRLARYGVQWLARIIEFQPGERTAVIGVTAILAGPRTTFLVLLGCGLAAAFLAIVGAIVRSFTTMTSTARSAPGAPAAQAADTALITYRDDGIIAQSLGRFVDGQLPPLLPAVAGVTVAIILSAVGVAHLPGPMVFAPVVAMALAGLGSGHPHDGRLDWLVPPLLEAGEYVFLAALALAWHVPIPLLFTLIAVIALHHYDVVHRVRHAARPAAGARPAGTGPTATAPATGHAATGTAVPARWVAKAGLGWEGRMLAAALGAMLGVTVFAFAVLAVYLWVLFGWESVTGWIAAVQREQGGLHGGFPAVPRAAARSADVEDGGSR